MKKNMGEFRENSEQSSMTIKINKILGLSILFLVMLVSSTNAQMQQNSGIEEVAKKFLEVWLVNGDVNTALTYIADKPIFPACWVGENESLEWRKTRSGVIEKVKPVFAKLAEDSAKTKELKEVIASQRNKLAYPIIKHGASDLFDIYPVNNKLRETISGNLCGDRELDTSEFIVQGIKNQKELYLMLFHFKEGLLVTMLWTKEGDNLRILQIDFPTE